jgi:uncharacterized Rossmann fold enzyme
MKGIAAGEALPLFPVGLAMEGCFTEEVMNANFFATLERGYTPINDYIGKFSGTCSIVGSGPTIEQTHTELVGDVIAINGAIKYLLQSGIVPKFGMIWDCDPVCWNFAEPHPDVTYLIASRAHPKVFERLRDCKVIVWHAAGDLNINELMNRPEVIAKQPCHEPLINGGTAGVTRCMYVAMTLGYKDLHIFGGDSCYLDDKTHVQGSLVAEKDMMVSVGNDPPAYFRTTPEWCAQVEEYRTIYAIFTALCGLTLSVHGYSMLKFMHDRLEAQRAEMGNEGFRKHIHAQELHRQEMSKAASERQEERAA